MSNKEYLYRLLRCFVIAFALVGLWNTVAGHLDSFTRAEHETVIGTAWTLNGDGYIVTAYHVVHDHITFKAVKHGKVFDAELITTDKVNDIAILHIESKDTDYLPLKLSYANLDPVSMYGYPLPQEYGNNLKVSKGLLKHQLYSSYLRVNNAKVCPGNSGGPLISKGGVVGIVDEAVWPFAGNGCAGTSQGPTAKDIAKLATTHGIAYIESLSSSEVPEITENNVMEIYAWR